MVTHLTGDASRWLGARCSACVSEGRVAWAVHWRRGEMAAGVGCADAHVSKPAESRFALALVVDEHGGLGVRHAGRTYPACPTGSRVPYIETLEPGNVLTLLLNADSGTLTFTVREGGPMGQERWPPGSVMLPEELRNAALFPTLSLRRGASSRQMAEASISFAAPVPQPHSNEGFRPLALALASQRGGGRSRPLTARPPARWTVPAMSRSVRRLGSNNWSGDSEGSGPAAEKPERSAERSEDRELPSERLSALRHEEFLLLLGAHGHLPTCECKTWWSVMLSEAKPHSLLGHECSICMSSLVTHPDRPPPPGKEPVGTICVSCPP